MAELLRCEKLVKKYNSSSFALKGIDLSLESGNIVGLLGPNGSGKTTLLRCLNLLERPTSGSVLFDGVDLASLSRKELLNVRHSISMIFQGFNLLSQREVPVQWLL